VSFIKKINSLKKDLKKSRTKKSSKKNKFDSDREDVQMSIIDHLNEMRSRLFISLGTITVVTVITFFFFSTYIMDVINKPFLKTGLKLNVFTLSEGFILMAKAALVAGIFVGIPVSVYELWSYIKPAINIENRKFISRSIIASVFLMYAGAILTYFFLLPIAIQMLVSFTPSYMTTMINASKYMNFAILFSLAVGVLCELPIVILILTKIGLVTPKTLIAKRKYAIVIIWLAAGILTPGPDVLSQTLVAIPVTLLYEISIIISKVIVKRREEV
jgi:sec-independent protein translocase protein TatC